jgi:hypothetical protein
MNVLRLNGRAAACALVLAAAGCNKGSSAPPAPAGAAGTAGGASGAAGSGTAGGGPGGGASGTAGGAAGSGGGARDGGSDGPTIVRTCGPAPAVTSAPPDTATPPAATGPSLWKNVNITAGGFVSGIVFSPAQRDVVYARTDIGGAYRWNAAAKRWLPLLDWVTRANANWTGVESIAVDPTDANKVYVAGGTYVTSGNGVILRSSDQGRTFSVAMTSIPMGGNNDGRSVGERLAVDPNKPSTLYFGSRTMGLWKSTDGAATWSRLTSFPGAATTANGVGVAFVVLDPNSCGAGGQTTVYVALGASGTSIYASSDGGTTWAALPGQPTAMLPSHAAVSPTGHLFVTYGGGTGSNGDGPNNATTGAVWRFDVATQTFTEVTPMAPTTAVPFGYSGVSVDGTSPDTLVVCTLDRWSIGDEIFRSTDAGAHWTALGVAAAAHDVSAAPWVTFHQTSPNYTGWMADVEIDPFDSSRILHVTGQGIWASDDLDAFAAGQPMHWDFRSAGIEETAVLDLASPPAGPSLLSGVGDIGGFRHDDVDVTPPDGIAKNPVFTNTDSIDFAELSPTVVARVGRINATVNGTTTSTPTGALSTDGGTTWAPFATMPASGSGSSSAGSIAVSADGATLVWDIPANTRATPPVAGGPQVSRDGGKTWQASTGLGAIRPVFADRVNPKKMYAFDGANGRFYASTDGAATFAQTAAANLPHGNTGRPRAVPGMEGEIWLVTANSLMRSSDSGTSFAAVSSATAPVSLGFGKAPAGKTYPALFLIGTVSGQVGVYRSDDVGATWTRIDDAQHLWPTAGMIIGDPRVFGRAYVGTNGRGVLYADVAGN